MTGKDRIDCPTCLQTHAEFESEPPCETCKPQELMPGNEVAMMIYQKCQGQLIMGFSGPVDIDDLAVMNRIKLHKIPETDHLETLDKVKFIAGYVISERSKKKD